MYASCCCPSVCLYVCLYACSSFYLFCVFSTVNVVALFIWHILKVTCQKAARGSAADSLRLSVLHYEHLVHISVWLWSMLQSHMPQSCTIRPKSHLATKSHVAIFDIVDLCGFIASCIHTTACYKVAWHDFIACYKVALCHFVASAGVDKPLCCYPRDEDRQRLVNVALLHIADVCSVCGLLLCVVCVGRIHLQLVLDRGVVRAYTTPDNFIVPRSEWVMLVLACDGRQVVSQSSSLQCQLYDSR